MSTTLQSFQDLFQAYAPPPEAFDESVDAQGQLRLHYRALVDYLTRLGEPEMARRWGQAKRAVRDNGIAYSGYAGKVARPRTWELDALPILLAETEWTEVKRAISQRARLLNLVMQDIAGPQRLLQDGTLPAELLYSDPGYCRECRQIPISDAHLQLYAADIARAPDGKWWVLADRTEAPSGLGYTLEHRIVMSRMLPAAFRQSNVLRLAPYFAKLQETLRDLAITNRENPRVVLLSDGPVNPYHLEDAYLARYLGYLLVEDGDLAVRSSQVMLKTLGGLQPVDIILRRLNTMNSDPLIHNSVAGIAGLTQAALSNNVVVANQLGSGILESTAYLAFMPQLCKAVLGEELLIPNVATWWCGNPASLDFVCANIERLWLQPAFRRRGRDAALRAQLHAASKAERLAMIKANPSKWAAQERVDRSSVPVWDADLQAQRMAIRAYAVRDRGSDAYEVMDGGLGRVTESANKPLELSLHEGEGSKDVWVLSETPVEFVTLLDEPRQKVEVRRSGADLPSRVADNFFWLGRRMERAEQHARLISITASRIGGEMPFDEQFDVPMLLRCLANEGLVEPGYAVESIRPALPAIGNAFAEFVLDATQPNSLRADVDALVRLGSLVRDRLSVHAWKIFQRIDELFRQSPSSANIGDLLEISDALLMLLAALSGIAMESITRTQIFRFLDLGRRIERAQQVISIVEHGVLAVPHAVRPLLETTLELTESLMTYRARYMANVHTVGVLDLVLTDETNPRSLAYQLSRIKEHIDNLPRDPYHTSFRPEQRAILSLLSSVRLLDVEDMQHRATTIEELTQWNERLGGLSNLISHQYLVHSALPQQLTDMGEA